MLWIALFAMVCATIAQHLGLAEKVAQIGNQIMGCPKCLSFWTVLGVLLCYGCNILLAIGLSLLAAYAANWMGFVYMELNNIYSKLWQRTTNKSKTEPRKRRKRR
nr:MAG TPA: Protein of unknown function (DUF1360) [Bacteriophage sp.]DAQ26849.1 MAG TPA: Protein of unknown function (DUF1360) [Caudoviricetes sp.]